ncbi:hypothetical protein BRADI_2g36179v3 [Brachypodium distachyon]|uniref:NB-ARC domain-containing protein n=1 Tax=Brachypodium distachyon TaxID=15368 RepID=A0A0Q3J479_BRADI|nr:hypothetical protein BRADI_2g36179v3 [Brachypodium distachyon]
MAGLAIGSLLAAPILKVLVGQIGSAIGGHITQQKNFDKDLRRMKAALESVESVLEDAERRSITDKLTRLWLKELKVAMYAISDMIEEFEIDTNAAEPSVPYFSILDGEKMPRWLGEIWAGGGLRRGPEEATAAKARRDLCWRGQIFDLKKIGNSVITQLLDKDERKSFIPYTERQMIENSLAEIFAARKKILIVLDDLWEDKQIELGKLKDMLKLGNGSKVVVIVTTRNESIALEVCTIQPQKLAVLSPGICWSIIKHKSDFGCRDDKEELEQIGMDIATKCGGVALAAQSLGYVLKSMMPRQWESIRDSDIWSVYALGDPSLTQSEDQSLKYVLASLRLSYSVMPSHLKLCFAYCAIFPKGHKIIKDDLIR